LNQSDPTLAAARIRGADNQNQSDNQGNPHGHSLVFQCRLRSRRAYRSMPGGVPRRMVIGTLVGPVVIENLEQHKDVVPS
jgi:hypothetical protein